MSLETGSFIKDLVATNPDGADPKSQGDDHLRLIKSILKSQFSGFTMGIPITATEAMINAVTGQGQTDVVRNIDAGSAFIDFYGVVGGTTGTFPPGGAPGDFVLMFPFDPARQHQIWFSVTGLNMFYRVFTTAWSNWQNINGLGHSDQWTSVYLSRAFNTVYTNNRNRAIQVAVTAQASSGSSTYLDPRVNGAIVGRTYLTDGATAIAGSVILTVPPTHTYQVNLLGGGATILEWCELI